jgi:hypothetical protein
MSKIYLFILATIFPALSFAEIREVTSMQEALAVVQKGDIVIFDIDNTLLEPIQTLGSDQWFGSLVASYKKSGLSDDESTNRAIADWSEVQKVMAVLPVEATTPLFVKQLQRRGIMTLALTARPADLKRTSVHQLLSAGIEFRNHGYRYSDQKDILLYRGILFTGPHENKGIVLSQFFKSKGIHPSRLIFIDDKLGNVKNMDAVFTASGIPNINFRYGAADLWVSQFDTKITDIEWSYFQKYHILLTDEIAAQYLGH